MATVTVGIPKKLSGDHWEATLTPGTSGSTIYVYHQGALVQQSTATTVRVRDTIEPYIEAFDDADDVPNQVTYPGRARLQWYHVTGASGYRVYEYVDSAWTARRTFNVTADSFGYYEYLSGWLADQTTHQFRVVALDSLRNEGTEVDFNLEIVRNPDTPSVSYSYASGTLTVSAA